ncbi:hypothetical protein PG993_008135 [Apiospora rasikravindrae]|uniref:Uncharacterized protein n=1 Tax=Apiospora rasikravindrae TaxID=990691 RepID=A0ABR1T1B6_9PEZI
MPPPLFAAVVGRLLQDCDRLPNHVADITITDISSPDDAESETQYRLARQLPPELKQHCQIYLEENIHAIALNLLNDLLPLGRNGGDSKRATKKDAATRKDAPFCPPPNHIALLSTLIVHPDFTNRPKEETWPETANNSLAYLRCLLRTVGPINARFKEAFRFGSGPSRYPRGSSPSSDSGNELLEDTWGDAPMEGKYFKDSVWRRGQDFFGVVGWAFNCSQLYPNRWYYWSQWLDFMFDAIEADLLERHRLDVEVDRAGGRAEEDKFLLLRDSILAGFIGQQKGRLGGLKWIMKALFADGSKGSSSVFQEMWPNEHRGISKKAINKRKRAQVNLEKGEYGAWLDDESIYSSQASEPPTPQKLLSSSGKSKLQTLEPAFVESIQLRQRLFAMLSYLCNFLPDPPVSLPDLYESYVEHLKVLPLTVFNAFITQTTSVLRLDSQISILQDILMLLMPSNAVSPARVDADRYDANGTSPAIIERCFLPYASNTIEASDNAKVSMLLEELVQLVWVDGTEQFSPGLVDVVKKGVAAREAKVRKKTSSRGRGRGGPAVEDHDAEAKAVLQASGQRLLTLARMVVASLESEGESTEEDEIEAKGGNGEITFLSARGA